MTSPQFRGTERDMIVLSDEMFNDVIAFAKLTKRSAKSPVVMMHSESPLGQAIPASLAAKCRVSAADHSMFSEQSPIDDTFPFDSRRTDDMPIESRHLRVPAMLRSDFRASLDPEGTQSLAVNPR
jgi:hypothetical protein